MDVSKKDSVMDIALDCTKRDSIMDVAKAEEKKVQESQQDVTEPDESMGFEEEEKSAQVLSDTDNLSGTDLNRTEDMELNKTGDIAKLAFPTQLGTEDSQHVVAISNLDESITIDLNQSKASTQMYRGQSVHSKLSRAVR